MNEAISDSPEVTAAPSAAKTTKSEEIAKQPDPNCKKCFGRGHIGRDAMQGGKIPCRCTFSEKDESTYRQRQRETERQRSLSRK